MNLHPEDEEPTNAAQRTDIPGWLFVSVTYEKMTDPTVEKKKKKRTPSKNKSVTTANKCLFNSKRGFISRSNDGGLGCKERNQPSN